MNARSGTLDPRGTTTGHPPAADRSAGPAQRGPALRGRAPRGRALRRLVVNLVLMAAALGIVGVGVGVRTGNLHLQTVLTGSMRPGIEPGDLVATWRVPTSSLRVGDVITFFPPGAATPKVHRIVSLTRAPSPTTGAVVTTVKTLGDANHGHLDPWDPITISGPTAYRLEAVVPKLGWIPVWVSHLPGKAGRATLLVLAGLLFGVVAIKKSLSGKPGTDTDDQMGQPANTK